MKLVYFFIISILNFSCLANTLQVSFIIPNQQDDPFWLRVVDVANSVAEDLGVSLELHFSDTNRFASLASVEAISQMDNKPDFVIYRPIQGSVIATFDILESNQIPFVTLENGFGDDELTVIDKPFKKYKYWIGEISYDDEAGGALLTSALYKQHLKTQPAKTMHITGIGGGFERVSLARQTSLEKIYWSTGNVVVNQIFPTDWKFSYVKENFTTIYSRYPNTTAFWCVADLYSLAIIEQLKLHGKTTDQKILIGGFDWLPAAIDKIKTGEMTASVGGHFLMGGKALLEIVEYHNTGQVLPHAKLLEKFELIDSDNVDVYQPFIEKAPWPEIDYRQFSKVYTHQPSPLTISKLFSIYSQLKTTNGQIIE